jgi:hypothetical protein
VPAPVPVAAPAPPPPPKSPRQRTIEILLAEAEYALQQGRLTLPLHDNAYDRFQAVQLLEPHNEAAKAGLQAILLVYLDRVQQAMNANRLQAAAAELRQARQYFPAEPLDALAQELRKRGRDLEAEPVVVSPDAKDRVLLPPEPLSRRTEEVKKLLIQLAQRVRESDEAIVIHARSDAEGRWIYKTMRESVGEYRIRGDIRIVRQPAVVFQPPSADATD